MATNSSPVFDKKGSRTNPWNTYDQQPSDDDDDEPRLMIDTSEDDEDGRVLKLESSKKINLPLNFASKVSPERIKALAEATPTLDKFMKDMKIPPELDKLVKDASVDLKKKNLKEVPENFVKAMNTVMASPHFQKAIYEMKLSPSLEKALDEVKQCPGFIPDPKVLTLGCEKKTTESNSENDPLLQLQDFVRKPWNAHLGGVLPNTKISATSASGSQGCETVPVVGVNSKPLSSTQASSSNVKFRVKSRSTIKRSGAQLPHQQRKLKTIPSKFKSVKPPDNFINSSEPLPSSTRIDFVLNKLKNAARDEEQMQEFQRLSGSADFEHFKKFQAFLKGRYKDLSIHPPFTHMSEKNLVNQKIASHCIPLPPELTIIPNQDSQWTTCKPACRRSPPPMVPITSLANLRKPLSEEPIMLRLKRLGTDIELERTTTPVSFPIQGMDYRRSEAEDSDDDPVYPLSVDCILSTEPIVTIDETSDPLPLKYFDDNPKIVKKGASRTHIHPPPPSLIPISSCTTTTNIVNNKYVPLLPTVSKMNSETLSFKMNKKPKRKQKTAFKSEIAKLAHALVQPAGAMKNNEVEIVSALCRPSSSQNPSITIEREVEIFKIEESQSENIANKEEGNVIKLIRLEDNAIENGTTGESTFVENEEFSKGDTNDASVEISSENPKNSLTSEPTILEHANDKNITGICLVINSPILSDETIEDKATKVGEEAVLHPEEKTQGQELPVTAECSSPKLFSFQADDAIITNSHPQGRKIYICKICSGVYCKMYSAKKHYFRNHINPRMVNEGDALKFGLETNAKKSSANEGFYRCNECDEIFTEVADLKRHLLVHPVAFNENTERSRKNSASYNCDSCSETFSKKKLYLKHIANCAGNEVSHTPEIANSHEDQGNLEDFDEEKKDALGISRMCLFCDSTFTSAAMRKTHVLQNHHPKRKHQSCSYCKNKKFADLKDLLKHICDAHSKRYFGCSICKIRFKTKDDLTAHDAESHTQLESDEESSKTDVPEKGKTASNVNAKSGKVFKCKKCSKTFTTDKELKRHRKKGHKSDADSDTEYYRGVAEKVSFNLEFCLDGKIPNTAGTNNLKKRTRRGSSLKTRSSKSQQLRAERDNVVNKLTLDDMYGAPNLNSKFIASVSKLHLATQLAVLRKANLLENEPKIKSASTNYQASTIMAKELALTENSGNSEFVEEIETNNEAIFTGEWTRPKKYICSTCFARFSNFWDMEDHRWIKHPNVWVFNYEFPVDQAPGANWAMKRSLSNVGVLSTTPENNTTSNPATKCTKCQKVVVPTAEFHKHILECGGDTTWMSTMFASFSFKKNKKWKPYGGRRRRNVGRVRGLKRNIPTTPVKIIGLNKNRQKAGDSESIQRMIANLPPKRITRRIIQFDDVESKSQSRKSNVSNILTRRRKVNLDGKTNAQVSKSFETSGNISAKMPDPQKKKQSLRKKLKALKATSPNMIKQLDTAPNVTAVDSISSNLNEEEAIPAVDPVAQEASIEIPVAHITPNVKPDIPVKVDKDEPKADLGPIEPTDSDSLLPDSSVILAAMRETVRQTDTVMPSQTFLVTTKKRKRDDTKCKQESDIKDSCAEPKTKCVALSTITCVKCDKPFTSPSGNGIHICENCTSRRCKTRSASIRNKGRENKPRELRKSQGKLKQQVSSFESMMQSSDNEKQIITATIEEDSLSKVLINEDICSVRPKKSLTEVKKIGNARKITKAAKREQIKRNVRSLRNNELNKTSQHPEINELDKNQADASVKESGIMTKISKIDGSCEDNDVLGTKNVSKILQIKDPKVYGSSKNEKNIEAVLKSTNTKVPDISQNVKDINSAVELEKDDDEPEIISCEVCHCYSIHPVCDNCSSIARKNKICAFCKQTLAPKSNTLPICEACKISQYVTKTEINIEGNLLPKREMLKWIPCKVCKRSNHKVVCGSCVMMSQKHKICARCNVRWEDPEGVMPVCPPCKKIWYPPVVKNNEDADKCTECSTLQATEVTLRKLCGKCNATGITKKLSESVSIHCSNEISVQGNNEENMCYSIPTTVDMPLVGIVATNINTIPPTCPNTSSIQVSGSDASIPSTSVHQLVPSNSLVTTSVPPAIVSSSTSPMVTGGIPIPSTTSTPPISKSVIEEGQNNASPSKKNVILICKGCFGLYDKVSAYKQHCDTCLARVSCLDEKKPLLGFIKRNTNVVSNEVNNGGASFEILEGVQIKSYPLNEGEKIESDSANEISAVPASICDSDSSTSSKRPELCQKPKIKRSFATAESINDTINSVIMAVCYDSVPSTESNRSDAAPKLGNRKLSSSVTEIASSNLENFEKVKDQLKSSLETSVTENDLNTEISFTKEIEKYSKDISIELKKRKITPKKEKITNNARTTRSSLTKLDSDFSKTSDEISKTNGKTCRKRKANSECSSPIEEEATGKSTSTHATVTRLRQKPAVKKTDRFLRSRSKIEVPDLADDNENIEENPIKQESNEICNKTKKLNEFQKKVTAIDQDLGENQEDLVSDEEDPISRTRCKKQKSDLNDLGFVVMKTNKSTRRSMKRDSSESLESLPKNELEESDRKICESDAVCPSESKLDGDATMLNAASLNYPDSSQNLCDFLEATTPSTSVAACDESTALNGFSYDDSVRMDGYEASGPPNFDEGQPDGAQSTSWYSAINFLDQSSLGSILDSVNELLSRPEVASSCIADTIGQTLSDPQNDETVLQNLDNGVKTKNDNTLNQEDEAPTLMDLDHQTAHHLELKAKEVKKTSSPNQDACNSESSSSTKEICEVCEQSYPDSKSLKMHMSATHKTSVPTTRSTANGKLRLSVRSNPNCVKVKQKCSHCQKILVGKAEMASHLKEHLQKFASNKNNAEFMKKCITEKLEDLFLNKALDIYMKSPQESSVRNNPPLKILSQLNAAKKNQFSSWKSAIAQVLKLDASSAVVSPDEAGKSSTIETGKSSLNEAGKSLSNEASKSSSNDPSVLKSTKQSKKISNSSGVSKLDSSTDTIPKDGYPCPMCTKTFPLTYLRNQHLIMVHAPRQSTHKHLVKKKENLTKTCGKGDKNGPSDSSSQTDNNVVHSYLLNESVNSCLEAKKEAVNKAIAESFGNEKQSGGTVLSKSLLCGMQSIEEPPALEPAPSGEQVPNNMDRSPPKLEASIQSILRQNLTSSSTNNPSAPSSRNGKPCRKKMSKKEIDLPPAVVKFKAEQALLELSINKFRKNRN